MDNNNITLNFCNTNKEVIAQVVLPFKYTDKVIELGCGDTPLMRHPNWITSDYRKRDTVDLVFDFEKLPWPIEDNSYDGIYGTFIIEHIAWRHLKEFLSECFRILKPGGHIFMVGPNTFAQCQEIIKRNKITRDEAEMLFGGQDDGGWNAHKNAFSPESITKDFTAVGFTEIEVKPWFNAPNLDMQTQATKPLTASIGSDLTSFKNINFGSFTVMTKDWLNVDILNMSEYATKNNFNFMQLDCTKPLPFKSNSIKNITSSHMLEHLTRKEGLDFLKECYRILENDGVIRLCIPDTLKFCQEYLNSNMKILYKGHVNIDAAEDDAEAFWNFIVDGHKTCYDRLSLIKVLQNAGFERVENSHVNESLSSVISEQYKDIHQNLSIYVEGKKCFYAKSSNSTLKIDEKLNIGLLSTPFFGCPPPGYSGLEQVVWDLANGLSELGHTVTLFAPKGSKAPPNGLLVETGEALNAVNVDWRLAEENAFNLIKNVPTTIDILHGHTWFGYEYSTKQSFPALKVCHTHHGHINMDWWNTRAPFKLNLITISKWMKSLAEQQGFKSEYVYNGIDLNRYKFSIDKSKNFVYVGRISKFKQPHVAIEFAKRLGVELDVIGGTFVDDIEYLRSIEKMCDGHQIRFWPDATHDFKVEKLQKARALLFPSAMGEPFGLVAAEAMACGAPVIALNDGAISEVVQDKVTGFICKDIDEMISKCKLGVNNITAPIDEISNIWCRSRVESNFSRKVMAQNYLALYEKILKGEEW